MAAADAERPDHDDAAGRAPHAHDALGVDRTARPDGDRDPSTAAARLNIDRVADKVKGLLRSDS